VKLPADEMADQLSVILYAAFPAAQPAGTRGRTGRD
jgi:hypothetical protein